jgi:hypothetical protein
MNFFTQIEPMSSGILLDAKARITALGSCFAEVVGQRLTYYKWPVLVNPLGVLFHPLAISDLIQRALALQEFESSDLFQHQCRHYILSLHGQYSDTDHRALLDRANADLRMLREHLIQSSHMLITFGTAWAYQHQQTLNFVGNCHKLPGSFFNKKLLTSDQTKESVIRIVEGIALHNPKAQLIFSVSPVRHIKDGLVQNSLGKAHLISGLHAALNAYDHKQGAPRNFPAYELMVDQLRDYRFYKSDLIHPNDQGTQVVWEYFKDQWVDKGLDSLLNEIHSVQQGMAHRPLHPESQAHQEFLSQLKKRIEALEEQYPHLKFN